MDGQIELVKRWVKPTPISWPEVYTSQETHVVDGTRYGITDIRRMKFHKHLKHITSDGHPYMGALWFFNEARRKMFPRAHQHFLFDGLQQIKTTTCAFLTRNQVPAYEDFKKGRGSIFVPTPLEKAAFKTAVAPIHGSYPNKFGYE